jgi:hypothetical protein
VASENDARPCAHFGCSGTQRFTSVAALGGMPGWECTGDREHLELEARLDFSARGRAARMDALLNDLDVLKEEIDGIKDPVQRESIHRHVRLLISSVQTERNHVITLPGR